MTMLKICFCNKWFGDKWRIVFFVFFLNRCMINCTCKTAYCIGSLNFTYIMCVCKQAVHLCIYHIMVPWLKASFKCICFASAHISGYAKKQRNAVAAFNILSLKSSWQIFSLTHSFVIPPREHNIQSSTTMTSN